ncbi:MAG: signal peptidase II [Betaproteobacteria bacterium]|nr:signal peptidase II [Betaproteobacteria bacterium]MDH3438764.1 signal peptidase II [Betaproteobacteria bacterium]
MSSKTVYWLLLSALIVVIDQVTKFVVVQRLAANQAVEVTSFFNLVLVYNPGAAFSFLADGSGWQRGLFATIAVVASVWIFYLLRKYPHQRLFALALALILAGALGNLIDRIALGAVIDFLDFHAFGYHWPAFNVADSAITCGAVLLVCDALRPRSKP